MANLKALDQARILLRHAEFAVLATLDRHSGVPVATLVAMATAHDTSPVLLLSDLAEHTKNLAADPRASLLIDGTLGLADRLTGPRLTLIGRVDVTADDADIARYLLRHRQAGMLNDFADFHHYRFITERGHQVAGFGRIDAIESGALLVSSDIAAGLAAVEPEVIKHMHDNSADALMAMAGAPADSRVSLAAIDADGLDLMVNDHALRMDFSERLTAVSGLDAAIAGLTQHAMGATKRQS